MKQFAILMSPSANRVYARDAARLTENEISVFSRHLLDGEIEAFAQTVIGGVPYLTFRSDSVSERDLACLSNLSSLLALFAVRGSLLEPITVARLDRYDDDLISILKYVGKTNEHFTKLLLNVSAATSCSADRFLNGRLRVFDPMCGRGTTLNQAVMYGHDAYGVEIDKRDFESYAAFIQRWMKDKSIKHRAVKSRLKREGRSLGQRLTMEFAASKELYKAGDLQTLEMVNADTLHSGDIYRKDFFDLIVADVPYGVQHGPVHSSRSASPGVTQLLESAIPVWSGLLRAGGSIGLSWNTYVTRRDELDRILTRAGLEVMEAEPFLGFGHRVDQAINRDLIVARKPRESREDEVVQQQPDRRDGREY